MDLAHNMAWGGWIGGLINSLFWLGLAVFCLWQAMTNPPAIQSAPWKRKFLGFAGVFLIFMVGVNLLESAGTIPSPVPSASRSPAQEMQSLSVALQKQGLVATAETDVPLASLGILRLPSGMRYVATGTGQIRLVGTMPEGGSVMVLRYPYEGKTMQEMTVLSRQNVLQQDPSYRLGSPTVEADRLFFDLTAARNGVPLAGRYSLIRCGSSVVEIMAVGIQTPGVTASPAWLSLADTFRPES